MKIQEIFTEYIELKAYMSCHKIVFQETTLYNSYISNTFGNREVQTLSLTDYQNFANDLLLPHTKEKNPLLMSDVDYLSHDRISQIMDVLVSIYRFAIKSKYYIGSNLPLEIETKFDVYVDERFQMDLVKIRNEIEFGESLINIYEEFKKSS